MLLIFSLGVDEAIAMAFEKAGLHRVGEPEGQIFITGIDSSPVNQNFNFARYFFGFFRLTLGSPLWEEGKACLPKLR